MLSRRLASRNDPDGLEAVHFRHLYIHEHDVEAAGFERLDGLAGRRGDNDRWPRSLQHADCDLLVYGMILGQQDSQSALRRDRVTRRFGALTVGANFSGRLVGAIAFIKASKSSDCLTGLVRQAEISRDAADRRIVGSTGGSQEH